MVILVRERRTSNNIAAVDLRSRRSRNAAKMRNRAGNRQPGPLFIEGLCRYVLRHYGKRNGLALLPI
jgi:hypothetical protein